MIVAGGAMRGMLSVSVPLRDIGPESDEDGDDGSVAGAGGRVQGRAAAVVAGITAHPE